MLVASVLVSVEVRRARRQPVLPRRLRARRPRALSQRDKDTYAWVEEQVAKVPMNVSVGVTNKMGPHISNRKDVIFYPEARLPEYVFLDEGELKPPQLDAHRKLVERGDFRELSRNGKLALLVRRGL
jgi:hypothetical protein